MLEAATGDVMLYRANNLQWTGDTVRLCGQAAPDLVVAIVAGPAPAPGERRQYRVAHPTNGLSAPMSRVRARQMAEGLLLGLANKVDCQ